MSAMSSHATRVPRAGAGAASVPRRVACAARTISISAVTGQSSTHPRPASLLTARGRGAITRTATKPAPWMPSSAPRRRSIVSRAVETETDEFDDIEEDTSPKPPCDDWTIKYLFDGGCSVAMLKGKKGHEKIWFEDISLDTFKASNNKGITYDEAMKTIHVIRRDDTIITGMDALTSLYDQVGLGWVFKLAKLPGLSSVADIAYKLISKNRMAIGGGMDGMMLAVNRISMEEKGEGSCSDPEGECREKPMKEEAEEVDPAEAEVVRGGVSDRRNVLSIYTFKGGDGFRAAPVDTVTGKFTSKGRVYKLENIEFDSIASTVERIVEDFKWKGAIGVGLPGLVSRRAEDGDEVDKEDNMALVRKSRGELEAKLKKLVGKEVAVMTGAEANGYGEMAYGAGKDLQEGLVMVVTVGTGIGVALFDDGVLVRNVGFTHTTWSWKLAMWEDARLPSSAEKDEEPWQRWAGRVENYLEKLVEEVQPRHLIIGGAAGGNLDKWQKYMKEFPGVTIHPAKLGTLAGVKGAGAGGAEQLTFRDDLMSVRSAIGRAQGISPQAISPAQLKDIFDSFETSGEGQITVDELVSMLNKLGVELNKREQMELFFEMDIDNDGGVSFPEFYSWWREFVKASPVTLMHTEREWDNVLEENETSGRMVVLQVGFTYCRPCKAFAPQYKAFALTFSDARFVKVQGNENAEMVHLGRDRLKIKSTPTFIFFRNGEEVHRHGGASPEKFEDSVKGYLRAGEAGFEPGYEMKSQEYWAEKQAEKAAAAAAAAK